MTHTPTPTFDRNNGMPLWVKFVYWIGFPIIVAFFFMSKEMGWFVDDATAYQQRLVLEHRDDTKEMVRLLRIICGHSGGTTTQCGHQ